MSILDIDYLNLFPISTNITFLCPFGYVFSNDWFATPMLIISCQESGAFEMPDWDEYVCVEGELLTIDFIILKTKIYFIQATTTECYDCTTTSKYAYSENCKI